MTKRAFKVFACEVMQRELGHLASGCPHLLEFELLPVGHHDRPKEGSRDLQQRIDAVPQETYDAILVGYGLCSRILQGLQARHTPLVVPRAHDCITFFLGSKERYREAFQNQPGTYYFTAGWLEFPEKRALKQLGLSGFRQKTGEIVAQGTSMDLGSFDELAARYGEENARYLLDTAELWSSQYGHGTLIELDCTASLKLHERVQGICQKRGWSFTTLKGDLGLLNRWLHGEWQPEEILVVPPHHEIQPTFDDRIIEARPLVPS